MLEQLTVLDERVQVESFDAVFLPGGYGAMFDLQDNPLRGACWRISMPRDRILAAVCHGSVAFVEPKCRNGLPLVEGCRMTVITDSEEYVIGL